MDDTAEELRIALELIEKMKRIIARSHIHPDDADAVADILLSQ